MVFRILCLVFSGKGSRLRRFGRGPVSPWARWPVGPWARGPVGPLARWPVGRFGRLAGLAGWPVWPVRPHVLAVLCPLPSDLGHPTSDICPLPCVFRPPTSNPPKAGKPPTSSIQHPVSSIQHPASSTQYPASSIQIPDTHLFRQGKLLPGHPHDLLIRGDPLEHFFNGVVPERYHPLFPGLSR